MLSPADSATDIPPVSPLQRQGVIEIDTFCTGCHYNLHGQVVTIDERLGLPICRCPECGKFHPAGTGVTASNIWIRRFASILLFWWITIVIGTQLAVAGAMAGLDISSIGMYDYGYQATLDGKPVTQITNTNGNYSNSYVLQGTNITVAQNQVHNFRGLRPWYGDVPKYEPGLSGMVMLSIASLLLGFIAATLCVSLLWHWPRWRYLYLALGSLIPAAVGCIPFTLDDEYQFIRMQCYERIFSQSAIQCLGIVIGVILGRRLARQIARTIIPPKPRQALAFLWIADGKKPPTLTTTSKS